VTLDVFTDLPVRWEVAGRGGLPFPVLDADIVLAPHRDGGAVLGASGAYRLPPGLVSGEPGRALLCGVAGVTLRSLIRDVGIAMLVAVQTAGSRSTRNG
jgi:hypothetical protein